MCLPVLNNHLELLLGFELHVNNVLITQEHMLRGERVCVRERVTSGHCFVSGSGNVNTKSVGKWHRMRYLKR